MNEQFVNGLRKFLKVLESAESAEQALQFLVDAASELLQAEKISVVVRSESGLLQVRALHWPGTDPADGVAGKVLSTGESILVTDAEIDPQFRDFLSPRYRTTSFMSVPLVSAGGPHAVLNVTDHRDGRAFTKEDLGFAELLADVVGLSLERHRFLESIERLQKESVTDALTDLGNRRHFEQRMVNEMGRARRFSQPLSLIMLDIDDFKIYNDTYGHPSGDAALREIAQVLLDNVRAIDDVVRYGGEEFAIILPQTPIDLATVVAERVRAATNELDLEGASEVAKGRVSVSLGVAAYPRDARDDLELVNHADIALYIAKSEGKDRIVVFEPLKEEERRSYRRIPIRLNTVISGEDHRGKFEEQTMTRNISAGGALFSHRRQLDMDTAIHMSIQNPLLGNDGKPSILHVDSRLIRVEGSGNELYGAVAFDRELPRFS